MKNTLFFALSAMLVAWSFSSCCQKKLNPPVEELPSQVFELQLTELRDARCFVWDVADGQTDNHEETVRDLYVTAYNTVTLKSTASVNVASMNPAVVSVTRSGESLDTFELHYKGEGRATIRVWNGPEDAPVEQSFTVVGKEAVDVEGLLFTYAGEPLLITHFLLSRPPICAVFPQDEANEDKHRPGISDFLVAPYELPDVWSEERQTFVPNPSQGALLVFEGLYPENTSFRRIRAFESEWDAYRNQSARLVRYGIIEEGQYPWPNRAQMDEDYSALSGTAVWVALCDIPFYMASVRVDAPKPRYYYLFHASERTQP